MYSGVRRGYGNYWLCSRSVRLRARRKTPTPPPHRPPSQPPPPAPPTPPKRSKKKDSPPTPPPPARCHPWLNPKERNVLIANSRIHSRLRTMVATAVALFCLHDHGAAAFRKERNCSGFAAGKSRQRLRPSRLRTPTWEDDSVCHLIRVRLPSSPSYA